MNKTNLRKSVDRGVARISNLRASNDYVAKKQRVKTDAYTVPAGAQPALPPRADCPFGYACPYPPAQDRRAPSPAPCAPTAASEPEYLSPYEIAATYGINVNTVYQLIHDGKVDAFRIGRCWRVVAKSVKRAFNLD